MLYKVGDEVVIGGELNAHEFEIGSVVRITEIDNTTVHYFAVDSDGEEWWIQDEEIDHYATDLLRNKKNFGFADFCLENVVIKMEVVDNNGEISANKYYLLKGGLDELNVRYDSLKEIYELYLSQQ